MRHIGLVKDHGGHLVNQPKPVYTRLKTTVGNKLRTVTKTKNKQTQNMVK